MMKWMRRLRGAIGMGVTWAAAWAVAGVLIGVVSRILPFLPWDSFFKIFDAPLPALAIPGFVAGAFFSIVLGVAARGRTVHDLSVRRVAAWGAIGGVLLTFFPVALVALGVAHLNASPWPALAIVGVPFVLLGAASGSVTLLAARHAEARQLA